MPSKLESYLLDKKIDLRKLVAVSRNLESHRPEDRTLRLAKRLGAKAEGADAKKVTGKPRSGRPITQVAIDKIFAGKPVNGPTKTRLLRAVNAILELKKQAKIELTELFEFSKPA